ncbi:MAG TPA: L,D-transpeptidase [Thermoanaerobaculia bacterium]
MLALGLASVAVAGEIINIRDDQRLERVAIVDKMIAERTGGKTEKLRTEAEQREAELQKLQQKVEHAQRNVSDPPDSHQVILVSTAENKVYVRRGGQQVYEAVCSTGKGHRLAVDGRTLVFETPTGKFRVKSKEQNPMWVPPDWHYVEQARKHGMRVVRLNYKNQISLSSGQPVSKSSGVWGWFDSSGPVLRVKGNTVVADYGSYDRELPHGEMIYAGGSVVIPPVGTPQRKFDKVLGRYRLNLGDGYALHGTQETSKLGQSVSHGCVRLGDQDIEQLYQMASVGDEVIIY